MTIANREASRKVDVPLSQNCFSFWNLIKDLKIIGVIFGGVVVYFLFMGYSSLLLFFFYFLIFFLAAIFYKKNPVIVALFVSILSTVGRFFFFTLLMVFPNLPVVSGGKLPFDQSFRVLADQVTKIGAESPSIYISLIFWFLIELITSVVIALPAGLAAKLVFGIWRKMKATEEKVCSPGLKQTNGLVVLVIVLITAGTLFLFGWEITRRIPLAPATPVKIEKSPVFTPTPSLARTEKWNMYANDYFSMKFPPNVKAEEIKTVYDEDERSLEGLKINDFPDYISPKMLSATSFEQEGTGCENELSCRGFGITVYIFENKQKLDSDTWYRHYDFFPRNYGVSIDDKTKTLQQEQRVGNYAAKADVGQTMYDTKGVLLPIDNRMYLFYMSSYNGEGVDGEEILDLMTLTFKEEFSLDKESLVGVWQDGPSVGSGYSDLYFFYSSGRYENQISQMNCSARDRSFSGIWKLTGSTLILTEEEKTVLVGGEMIKASGSCGTEEHLVNAKEERIVLPSTKVTSAKLKVYTKKSALAKKDDQIYNYPSIFINDSQYWRLSFDPLDDWFHK